MLKIRDRFSPSREMTDDVVDQIRELALPLEGPDDLDPLLERIGDARYVLLGEASHGTAEYYTWRTEISKRLIVEKGFSFIAVEGDWPDCYRVNRYAKNWPDAGGSAREVLHGYERWPTWMWANREVVALVEWLRDHNDNRDEASRVGFYGLDLYSLWDSLDAVIRYLQDVDPGAVEAARHAVRCFEPYWEDEQAYARSTMLVPDACQKEVVRVLQELCQKSLAYQADDPEAFFNAEQNAIATRDAESYYRAMVRGGSESWNVRDQHMADALERLMGHHGSDAKAIVWEHNTHIGDGRATDMANVGMVTLGQLVRERHEPDDVVLVGFGSYAGSVIAGRHWGAQMERMRVPPARPGSYEHALHEAGQRDKLLIMPRSLDAGPLSRQRGHRAIGVVYRPEHESYGNYVPTVLPERYDAFLYIDRTEALHPLHMEPVSARSGEMETYPTGV